MKKFSLKIGVMLTISAMILMLSPGLDVAAGRDELRVYDNLEKNLARYEHAQDRIIVKFKNDSQAFRVLDVPRGKVKDKVLEYSRRADVEYAEPDYAMQAFASAVNDPLYSHQWHFENINLEEAWGYSAGGSSDVTVAVIDTGIAYENNGAYKIAPDLGETNFAPGYDFVNNDSNPNDDNGHGTHVAGTIAQSTNNKLGVAGIAYNTTLMPIKVLDKNGSGYSSNIAKAINYAADNGADVINMSLGGGEYSQSMQDAINYAANKGVVVVAASGNDNAQTVSYPAAYNNVIAVGATRYDNQVTGYTNIGSDLDIVAPGGDLAVDQNGDGYGDGVLQETFGRNYSSFSYYFYTGTSMASPHVAGVAALLKSYNNTLSATEITEAILSTATNLGGEGWDLNSGWGLLNAGAALASVEAGSVTGNHAPVIVSLEYSGNTAGESVYFKASATDADGDTLVYSWDFGDGYSGEGFSVTHVYSTKDTYTATLTVTDGKGGSATNDITILIDNYQPTAFFTFTDGIEDLSVIFNASESSDPDVDTLTYSWNFGDGSLSMSGEIVEYAYTSGGSYDVTLTVDDGNGGTDSLTKTVVINEVTEPSSLTATIDSILSSTRAIFTTVNAQITVSGADSLAGLSVIGRWTINDGGSLTYENSSGTTDSEGGVTLSSPSIKKAETGDSFILQITNIGGEDVSDQDIISDYIIDGSESRFDRTR